MRTPKVHIRYSQPVAAICGAKSGALVPSASIEHVTCNRCLRIYGNETAHAKPKLPALELGTLKVEVIADSTGKWVGNGLRFHGLEEAKTYGADLFSRWTAVRSWRVVDEATGEVPYLVGG